MYSFEILDINNKKDLEEYERRLYQAFKKKIDEKKLIWNIMDNERIITKIPYEDQVIFIAKRDNKIVAANSHNFNTKNKFQLEYKGFSIDKSKKVSETIALFNLEKQMFGESSNMGFKLRDLALEYLYKNGIKYIFATADKRMAKKHERYSNMKIIEERRYCNKTICLIGLELTGE